VLHWPGEFTAWAILCRPGKCCVSRIARLDLAAKAAVFAFSLLFFALCTKMPKMHVDYLQAWAYNSLTQLA
jgi:hypothetical protein